MPLRSRRPRSSFFQSLRLPQRPRAPPRPTGSASRAASGLDRRRAASGEAAARFLFRASVVSSLLSAFSPRGRASMVAERVFVWLGCCWRRGAGVEGASARALVANCFSVRQ